MQLRQFVVSRAHNSFAELAESIRTFQEHLEVDTVTYVFKSVSFSDEIGNLCKENHKTLNCPSLCSLIEMEVSSSSNSPDNHVDSRSRSPNRDYRFRTDGLAKPHLSFAHFLLINQLLAMNS